MISNLLQSVSVMQNTLPVAHVMCNMVICHLQVVGVNTRVPDLSLEVKPAGALVLHIVNAFPVISFAVVIRGIL